MTKKAVVIFSGGQDSTTVLGIALHSGFECVALSFNYGQKHEIELQQAAKIAHKLGVRHHVIDVREFGTLVASKSALLNNDLSVNEQSPLAHMDKGVPASFVPNRNALFLTIAHGYAQTIGADSVWTGVCQTDYSGYPDCRLEFVQALEKALNIGYQSDVQFITPLMNATKAETFMLAEENGVLDVVLEDSHTCYNGVRGKLDSVGADLPEHRFEWGHGCGECPACLLRAKGWTEYQELQAKGFE